MSTPVVDLENEIIGRESYPDAIDAIRDRKCKFIAINANPTISNSDSIYGSLASSIIIYKKEGGFITSP